MIVQGVPGTTLNFHGVLGDVHRLGKVFRGVEGLR